MFGEKSIVKLENLFLQCYNPIMFDAASRWMLCEIIKREIKPADLSKLEVANGPTMYASLIQRQNQYKSRAQMTVWTEDYKYGKLEIL